MESVGAFCYILNEDMVMRMLKYLFILKCNLNNSLAGHEILFHKDNEFSLPLFYC